MDQEYKGFLISGEAGMVHPFSRDSYPAGTICKHGRASSIVEVMRFELRSFAMDDAELAKLFGLEVCRMVVDTCLGLQRGRAPDRR
jgi:hypothetical protein